MSVTCCRVCYRHTNEFTIIHFYDGIVSEGFNRECSLLLKYHVCKVEGSELNAVKNELKLLIDNI